MEERIDLCAGNRFCANRQSVHLRILQRWVNDELHHPNDDEHTEIYGMNVLA